MRQTQLGRVDLNLLPTLEALLEERHVSHAAERVDLSQPATSRALQRLRRVLGDELLIRTPEGFQLTTRAERLSEQLADLMPRLERLFSGDVFNPYADQRSWQMAGTDYAVSVFGAALFQTVRTRSPHSSLHWHPWHERMFDEVDRGHLDIVFFGVDGPPHLRSERLFTDRFVCLVGHDHPLADRTAIELEEYLTCSHVVVDVDAGGQPAVELALAARGTPRCVSLTVPYHAAAVQTVPGTDLVATIPARIVEAFADPDTCHVIAAPSDIQTMSYGMTWHPRNDDDPAHQWLRAAVRDASTHRPTPD